MMVEAEMLWSGTLRNKRSVSHSVERLGKWREIVQSLMGQVHSCVKG